MQIIPTLLVPTYRELTKQLKQTEPLFDYVQLDIMDGVFVNNKSFDYNEPNTDLNQYLNHDLNTDMKFELHLMVKDPLTEIEKWKNIKNVFRVIFHIESDCNPKEVINKIRANCWQAGIAINPGTPLSQIKPYYDIINMVLFMTVVPGKQGNKFVPEVGEKVKKIKQSTKKLIIAVDGSVNKDTITEIKSWGVEVFNVGSALMGAEDINKAYKELRMSLRGA